MGGRNASRKFPGQRQWMLVLFGWFINKMCWSGCFWHEKNVYDSHTLRMFRKEGSSSSCHSFKHSWLKYLFKQLALWYLSAGVHELSVTGSVTSWSLALLRSKPVSGLLAGSKIAAHDLWECVLVCVGRMGQWFGSGDHADILFSQVYDWSVRSEKQWPEQFSTFTSLKPG